MAEGLRACGSTPRPDRTPRPRRSTRKIDTLLASLTRFRDGLAPEAELFACTER
jgi:hypothetical protein